MRNLTFLLTERVKRQWCAILLVVAASISFLSDVAYCKSSDKQPNKEAADVLNNEPLSDVFQRMFMLDSDAKRIAKVVSVVEVNAPARTIEHVLSDFSNFPVFMKRVKSVAVTKREGNLFFTESFLKAQLFVSTACNHTITDILSKPNTIEWVLIDGNFSSASGRWHIESVGSTRSRVTYTVAVDPGPLIPANVAEIGMKLVQKEVVAGMKWRSEDLARTQSLSHNAETANSI